MKEPIDDAVIGPVGLSVDRSAFVGVGSGNRLQILRRIGHTRPLFGHTAGEPGEYDPDETRLDASSRPRAVTVIHDDRNFFHPDRNDRPAGQP